MTAYRFCRTDDMPLLVRAYNHSYAEPDDSPPITVEDFRRWRRELDVWCSSCMVALEGDEIVGVLIGAKRAHASFIHTVAVRPEHRRRGHARHMLESLARKMAILEPRLLLAEVPAENTSARRLLEACGYQAGETLVDWVADPLPAASESGTSAREEAAEAVNPMRPSEVTWSQLETSGALTFPEPRSWLRSTESLRAIRAELRGLAFVSDARIEAWLLYRDRAEAAEREIVAVSASEQRATEERARAALLGALLHEATATTLPTRLPRSHPREAPVAVLAEACFRQDAEYVMYASSAAPG